jgi:replication initiation protein RepC
LALAELGERFIPPTRKALTQAVKDAALALKLNPTQRTVLEKLASCYGGTPVDGRLLVWPRNRTLEKATNLNERAIRRAVSGLIAAGLVIPKDCDRRNRFARKDRLTGEIREAYGFDLSPVWADQARFAGMIMADEQAALEIASRDREIRHLQLAILSTLAETTPYDPEDRAATIRTELAALDERCPRRGRAGNRDAIIAAYRALRRGAEELFYALTQRLDKSLEPRENTDRCAGLPGAPIRPLEEKPEDSNEGFKSPLSNASPHSPPQVVGETSSVRPIEHGPGLGPPVDLIATACPDSVAAYGERINAVADVIDAGHYLRPSLQASPDAWFEGQRTIGDYLTGILVLYTYQVATDEARRPSSRPRPPGYHGGVFRSLIRRTRSGAFDVRSALLALRRMSRSWRN